MATVNAYDIGDLVRVTGSLTTSTGVAVDPSALTAVVKAPDGTQTTFVYGTDSFPIRTGTGQYYVDVTPTMEGEYYYRFTSTATGQASDEGYFRVRARTVA